MFALPLFKCQSQYGQCIQAFTKAIWIAHATNDGFHYRALTMFLTLNPDCCSCQLDWLQGQEEAEALQSICHLREMSHTGCQ